jgi:hypothetical protein
MHLALLLRKNNEIVEAALPNVSHGDGCTPECVGLGTSFGAEVRAAASPREGPPSRKKRRKSLP